MKTFTLFMAGILAIIAFTAVIVWLLYRDNVSCVLGLFSAQSAALFLLLPHHWEKAQEKKRIEKLCNFYKGKVPQARYV